MCKLDTFWGSGASVLTRYCHFENCSFCMMGVEPFFVLLDVDRWELNPLVPS